MTLYEILLTSGQLVALTIPDGWLVGKNALFSFDTEWLNRLSAEEKWLIDEIFLDSPAFHASLTALTPAARADVFVSPCCKKTENGQYENVQYTLELVISRPKRKTDPLFSHETEPTDFDTMRRMLNQTLIQVFLHLEAAVQSQDFSRLHAQTTPCQT